MVKIPSVLALALVLGACEGPYEPTAPAPAPASAPAVVARSTPPAPAVPPAASTPRPVRAQPSEPPPELDPAGVLDDEERRLLEADDATLTRDERIARAEAQRELVMADSEHPLRPVLETIERKVASGEARLEAQERWSGRAAFPDRDEEQPPHG